MQSLRANASYHLNVYFVIIGEEYTTRLATAADTSVKVPVLLPAAPLKPVHATPKSTTGLPLVVLRKTPWGQQTIVAKVEQSQDKNQVVSPPLSAVVEVEEPVSATLAASRALGLQGAIAKLQNIDHEHVHVSLIFPLFPLQTPAADRRPLLRGSQSRPRSRWRVVSSLRTVKFSARVIAYYAKLISPCAAKR